MVPGSSYSAVGHNDNKNKKNKCNSHLWGTFSVPGSGLSTYHLLSYLIFTALNGRHHFLHFAEVEIRYNDIR